MIKFKDDSDRLVNELGELVVRNPALYDVLVNGSEFVENQLKKEFILTMIFRTQDEQDQIYRDDPKYQTKKFVSPHQIWEAADLRSLIFTDDEISQVEKFFNDKYNATNVYSWTARNHKVGQGAYHFHIQFASRK